jgi:hypothetical protein
MDYVNLEEEFGKEKNSKGAKRRKKARGREQVVAVLLNVLRSPSCMPVSFLITRIARSACWPKAQTTHSTDSLVGYAIWLGVVMSGEH